MSDAIQAPTADTSSEAQAETQENQEQVQEASAPTEGEELRTDAEIEADKSLSKEEKKVEKRVNKLRLKYNGKEYDEELPFELPDTKEARDYMQKHLQMSKLSQSKSQEAAQWQKDATEFLDALKKNPRAVLSDPTIGLDLKKFAAEIIEEEIENSKKSPAQLELEKAQGELKRLKEERKREEEDRKSKDFERHQSEAFERYETLIDQALNKSDLPKTPYTVKKMADYMLLGLEKGIDVTPEDVVSLVRDEMHTDLQQMFAIMPAEVIEQIVGRENINKIRKSNLAKAKNTVKPSVPLKEAIKDIGQKTQKKDDTAPKLSYKDFFKV